VILLLILHFIVVISNVCILVYCSLLTMLYLMFAAKFYSATDENTDIWNSTELKQSFFLACRLHSISGIQDSSLYVVDVEELCCSLSLVQFSTFVCPEAI
jgi:hypothetical protein